MRADWDRRARENARHFIATGQEQWSDEEFFASGRQTVAELILNDMTNICQTRSPKDMRVLEIGCGAGRVTRALAEVFGEVHAVDVSGEMIERARAGLKEFSNVHLYQNNGTDLTVVPQVRFDFAFSVIVFQHIPSPEIVENYAREVHRLLVTGSLFKFQVNGIAGRGRLGRVLPSRIRPRAPSDTWLGAPISEAEAVDLASRTGFDCRYRVGAGTQDFWLWYFKSG
jgi:SAM-dependent methyltransferase